MDDVPKPDIIAQEGTCTRKSIMKAFVLRTCLSEMLSSQTTRYSHPFVQPAERINSGLNASLQSLATADDLSCIIYSKINSLDVPAALGRRLSLRAVAGAYCLHDLLTVTQVCMMARVL